MSVMAIVISALAFAFSLFTFFRYDAKLKKQERLLNNFKIKEYEDAEQDNLYAHLSMDIYWRDKGTLILSIKNGGPSDAYNVCVENLDKDSCLLRNCESSFPISTIDAGDSVEMELLVYSDIPEKIKVKVTWNDDSKVKHADKVVLQIH